jgi:hypothetical protein
MAPKATKLESVRQENGVPPSIIAQAEAAIAANTPPSQRRPSQERSRSSHFQENLQKSPGNVAGGVLSGFHIPPSEEIANLPRIVQQFHAPQDLGHRALIHRLHLRIVRIMTKSTSVKMALIHRRRSQVVCLDIFV